MSTFALFTIILLLFVFAAGLAVGSLARSQRELRRRPIAEEREPDGALTPHDTKSAGFPSADEG